MKPRLSIPRVGASAGYLLIECLVYISVFAVLLGIGYGAFYVCWDYSKALHYATDDINAALHAGERWRADIRNATGKNHCRDHAERRSFTDSLRDQRGPLPFQCR